MNKAARSAWRKSGWGRHWRPGQGYWSAVVTVTPEMAREYLANEVYTKGTNHKTVARYIRMMKRGLWKLNGQTIIFDSCGRGRNGHHRCLACSIAGVPFKTFVAFGILPGDTDTIDVGPERSMWQAIGASEGKKEDPKEIATVTRMIQVNDLPPEIKSFPANRQVKNIGQDVVKRVRQDCWEGVRFAMEHLRRNSLGLGNVSIKAAAAKAYPHASKYPQGRKRLADFCKMLCSGMIENKDCNRAVHVLREHILSNVQSSSGSHDQGLALYRKSAYCLLHFLRGASIDRVDQVRTDPFPLRIPGVMTDEEFQSLVKMVKEARKSTPMAEPLNHPTRKRVSKG